MDETLAKYVLGLPLAVREELRNAMRPGDGRWFVIGRADGDSLINEPSVYVAASGGVALDRDSRRRAYVPCSEAAILERARVLWGVGTWRLDGSGQLYAAELVWAGADGLVSIVVKNYPTALEASIRLLAAVIAAREVGHG